MNRREKKCKDSIVILNGILIIAYFAMLAVCICLNRNDKKGVNLIINAVMFGIVFAIFAWAIWGCLKKADSIKNDLMKVTEQIQKDYSEEGQYLWNTYSKEEQMLFEDENLREAYDSYKREMRYLESQNVNGPKCDIEDYINRELLDDVAKRNLLNLVPGAMTGMGILGTFIGLSFGLQNFNTGTSEEIAESIAPLMGGIKVAFHTSIYGMVFSLIFNLVYKNVFEETYREIDKFIAIYHKVVSPDAENDSISKIISIQQQQLQQMQQIPQALETVIGARIAEQIIPKMDALNTSFEVFAKMVGETQLKGMEGLIDKFTSQTNAVMSDSFENLRGVISQTCELQTENSEHMQTILTKVQSMTLSIQQINELSQKTVADMSGYVEKVESLQDVITENCRNFGAQLEQNAVFEDKIKGYVDTLEEYQRQCGQAVEQCSVELKRQGEIFAEIEQTIIEDVKKEMELLVHNSGECNKQISDAASQQIENLNGSFSVMNDKLKDMSDGFNGCMKNMIQELENTSQGINEQLRIEIMKTLAEFSEGFTKDISDMTEKLGNTAEQLGNTASELGTMATGFNGHLKKNLTDTFNIFDKELADICSHLSGTISDIQNTTERVPKVVGEAFERMEKDVSEIEHQMHDLINQVSVVNSVVYNQVRILKENRSEDFK